MVERLDAGSLRRSAAALLALLGALACGDTPRPAAEAPRLVILYAPCTVNARHLSPYEDAVDYTPNLERLAAESMVFERHHTEAGQSGIAYASIFSGSQADRHGVYRHPVRLRDDLYLVGEAFADLGYETFLWTKHRLASPELNYDQGIRPENTAQRVLRPDDADFLAILKRLKRDPDYKAFITANFSVTHSPYNTKFAEGFRLRHAADELSSADVARFSALYRKHYMELSWNYDATVRELSLSPEETSRLKRVIELLYASNVHELDRIFGGLVARVDASGLREQSLIAFTADHGELLFRENAPFQWSHSMQLAPEVLRVPLLIRGAGIPAGRYRGVTRSIDVFPTLVGLAGGSLPPERRVDGVDLSAAILGREQPPELTAFSHTTVLVRAVAERMQMPRYQSTWARVKQLFPEPDPDLIWVRIRRGDRVDKLKRRLDGEWSVESYDLARDPGESHDLYDAADARNVAAAQELSAYKARLVRHYPGRQAERERMPPQGEEQEALRELGYIR